MIVISILGYQSTKGLGNKLFRLIGDWIIAKDLYRIPPENFWIYYDTDYKEYSYFNYKTKQYLYFDCKHYNIKELLSIPFKTISKEELQNILESKSENYKLLQDNDLTNNSPFITSKLKRFGGLSNGFPVYKKYKKIVQKIISYEPIFNGTLALAYDKIPDVIWEKYKKYMKLFRINNNLIEDLPIDRATIGVHIRRGDFTLMDDRNTNKDEKYIKIINHLLENKYFNIFLASDDQKIQEKFKDIYGDKLYFIKTNSKIRDDKIAMKCIYYLSQCGHLIVSHFSSFSEISWWFSSEKLPISYVK